MPQMPRIVGHALTRKRPRSRVFPVVLVVVALACGVGLLVNVALWGMLQAHDEKTSSETSTTTITKATTAVPPSNPTIMERTLHQNDDKGKSPQDVRDEFYRRYGGQEAAEAMLAKGVHSFGSIEKTANRFLQAVHEQRPFVMAFAGYSITVGRGNYYHQSYPFVLKEILGPLLQSSLKLDLQVTNAAIGGIPSFPYGFCLSHFLGDNPDVVSWDFSMNEGSGAQVLESYLRQSQVQLKKPMVFLLDTNANRKSLIETYTDQGLLKDVVMVGMAKDVVNVDAILEQQQPDDIPIGFQHWKDFGSPPSCPGRGSWHPKYKEHELIAWMAAMYYVEAIQEAVDRMAQDPNWADHLSDNDDNNGAAVFPKPVSSLPDNDAGMNGLLYGHAKTGEQGADSSQQYQLNKLSCRTNFLPASDEEKVLEAIVVSGLAQEVSVANILETRSDEAYQSGWVLDVSQVERDTKLKVERCGGLGYVDMKVALYGIPESGPLRLWLPSETDHTDHAHADLQAIHWIQQLVLCEANEKRAADACHLDEDLTVTVGGIQVTPKNVKGAGEYLKRQTCVHVTVPEEAVLTRLGDVQTALGEALSEIDKARLSNGQTFSDDHVGLVVDLTAASRVTRKNGACCLSHVVWEQS